MSSLNPALVYRRTDRGLREVYEKSYQFTQSERLVLILLDGQLSVGALRARLPSLDNDRIERTIAKLEEAGLVEAAGAAELPSASAVEEVMRLQPEVVAEFLEQSDLDPITGAAGGGSDVAAELVRSSIDRAAAQLAEDPIGRAAAGAAVAVSDRSQAATAPGPFDDPQWNSTEATSFAITTVNVPDRLDMQEERNRVEMEEYSERRRLFRFEHWMKRVLVAAVVVVAGAVLYGVVQPLRDAASPARMAERLTLAFKRPVTVRETEFRLMPSPRLILRNVVVGGEFGAEQVTLLIHWKDLWLALNGGPWAWGQATVAPMALSSAQALAAARALPSAAPALPPSLSAVRFESIQMPGSRLFPGRYEAVLRRGDKGGFGALLVRQLDAGEGAFQLQFRPSTTEADATDFTLEAQRWTAPIGPRTPWNDVRASGRISGHVLEVSSYALGGFYGITTGTLFVAGDVEWVLTGTVDGGNLDVETVLRSLPGQPAGTEGRPTAFQGTAHLKLVAVGRGPTAEDAVARSVVAGPFSVRFAVLNGINLGLAATQGVGAAGSTRFTEFDGTLVASSTGIRFLDTGGRAGAMQARANITVAPDASIAGGVRVELGGGQRVQAPINLRLSGTAAQPRFGR